MFQQPGLHVLIVDDDPAMRALCRTLLEPEGYRLTEAGDGHAALELVARDPPHIIVMDALMPSMDGFSCTRRLKADPATRDIPVIMSTVLSETSDMAVGLEAGADEYLVKPIRPREFTLRVHSMARLYEGRMEFLRVIEEYETQARMRGVLLAFCRELAAAPTLDAVLRHTLSITTVVTASRRVSIMLPDETGEVLTIVKSTGIAAEIAASVRIPVGSGTSGQVYRSGRAVVINTLDEARGRLCEYESQVFASVPMVTTALGAGDRVVGVLNITDREKDRPFTGAELEYVDLIASIAGATIHDLTTRRACDDAQDSIVIALASLAERRDVETGRHLDRVTRFSLILAQELRADSARRESIDDGFLRELEQAVPLHDIGKVAIPDHILLKPGRLTAVEAEIMKTHAAIGATTLRSVIDRAPGANFLKMAEQIAHGHHEWYDGSGYPRGSCGSEIPLAARIVALADVYDALTTKRIYKRAYSHDRARAIILESSGTQFDPAIVAAFVRRERQFSKLALELADRPVSPAEAVDTEASPVRDFNAVSPGITYD